MATLEVHDGRGHVERVGMTPDDVLIFGSNPNTCSIVLDGPGVAPIHGRIRWQKRRYKVDAGAEVDAIEVNGKRLKSSTLYQGDEIRVGSCRIFVISTEDAGAPAVGDDKTRVQAAPAAYGGEAARPDPLKRQRPWKGQGPEPAPVEYAPPAPAVSPWKKIRSMLARPGDAPGQERVLTSPIVLGLGGTFVLLIVMSVGLYKVIVKGNADKQYIKAFESLDDGDYRNAIKQLDGFLEANPADPRSNKAKVFRALANVRQFTSAAGASWENALTAAQEMVAEVSTLPEYRDASTELAEQLIKAVEGLADRAKAAADPEIMKTAETALALETKVAGKANEPLLARSAAPAKLAQAREAIKRSQIKSKAFAAIDSALAASSASQAYEARDELVQVYPDLATDKELVGRLIKANDLIKKASNFDSTSRAGDATPHPDPLGPPTTMVLRLNPGAKPSGGAVVYAMADGLAIGLDGATGAPLWQTPVGLSSPFPPIPIGGGPPAVLLVDARYDELVRLDGRTGKLVWRQELGERVTDAPLLLGNQLFQATPSGKILMIDLTSGTLRGTLNLGRALTRTPVADASGDHLYVLGDQESLFVLDRDPLACRSVEYLGHEAGSIACAPARVDRFLVVPENTSMSEGRWRVFVLDETGTTVKPKQMVPVAGWTWRTPSSSGTVIWSASDRGEVAAYSIGPYDADEPFKPIGSIKADNQSSGPAYGFARTDREYWLAFGRSGRYNLDTEAGKLTQAWSLAQAGPAVAPIQVADKLAVFSQQSGDGQGVALWGIDPQNGAIRWRTTLGSPWPVEFAVGKDGSTLETLGFDGERLPLDKDAVGRGGFVEQPLPKAGIFRIPATGATWLSCGDATVLVPSPTGSQILVRRGGDKFQTVDLPSPIGARPIAWGKDVLIAGADGRVYLIDPATGESAADPYVPRFDKAHPSKWRTPVLLADDAVALADEEGHVRRLTRATEPRPRLVVTGEIGLGKEIAVDPASTGGSVVVATVDGKVRSLSSRDLSPVATVDLPASRTLGPASIGGHAFVGDATGEVFVFAGDGRKVWQTRLLSALNDAPAVFKGSAWFLTRSGALESRALADGAGTERLTLGVLPAGPPIVAGDRLLVPTGLGSFRPVVDPSGKGGN